MVLFLKEELQIRLSGIIHMTITTIGERISAIDESKKHQQSSSRLIFTRSATNE
jgi:hypothetical protein